MNGVNKVGNAWHNLQADPWQRTAIGTHSNIKDMDDAIDQLREEWKTFSEAFAVLEADEFLIYKDNGECWSSHDEAWNHIREIFRKDD